MLYIAVDLENREWLVYILEEFKRINRAEYDIKVISLNENITSANVIYYTKECFKNINFVNKSQIQPTGKIKYLSEKIFIIEDTDTLDRNFVLNYDLFWNVFVFLSRYEEYLIEQTGRRIQSYSFRHPRIDKATFQVPIVNNLFNEFENIIRNNFPVLTFGVKRKPVIELSHDVDYIEKTLQLKIKQTAFNLYNTFRNMHKPAEFLRNSMKILKFIFSQSSYWCFDYWEELERRLDKKSVFYVYTKTRAGHFKSWLFDPSYDIAKNIKLQEKLKHLIAEGFEVGLHGSFNGALDEKLLSKEKEILEDSLDCEIRKVRQHWLRYEENITPYIHNKLFRFDSTLGWNDSIGFRSGCLSRYRPYDHKNQKAFDFFETPLTVIDSSIFDYNASNVDSVLFKVGRMLENLQNYKTSHLSISWHQRVCSSDYNWNEAYKRLVDNEYI